MITNKRNRSRLAFPIPVAVGVGSKGIIAGKIKDISMNGIFVLCDGRIAKGSECGIEIVLTGKSSKLRIRAHGKVTRHTPEGMGVKFQDDLEWWPILEDKCVESFELKLRDKPFSR
jgi:hypothetical protein